MEINLDKIKTWLLEYSESLLGDPEIDFLIRIKQRHSARVAGEMDNLTRQLRLSPQERALALATAWLHDAGRFEQVVKYRKMFDYDTENHALLGVRVIENSGIIKDLDAAARKSILTAIAHHNKFTLNGSLNQKELLFCRLIRDADKLDIMDTILEIEASGDPELLDQVYLRLQEGQTPSPSALAQILAGKSVRDRDVRSRIDFRLLMMAWVYDLNFIPSFKAVKERKYLDTLAELLPPSEEVIKVCKIVKDYLERKLLEG